MSLIKTQADLDDLCFAEDLNADVELIWDLVWNQNMISEAGRMKLGMV